VTAGERDWRPWEECATLPGVEGSPGNDAPDDGMHASSPWTTVCLALLYFAAAASRRPSTLTNAQFWAEDGNVFYKQARELGFFDTLAIPYGGYLLTWPRVVASVSPALPLAYGPLLFNVAALLTQVLPAIFLASGRMRQLGPLPVRILLGVLYLGVPNVATVMGNLSNAQWHLAILSFLIVVAAPPRSTWAAAFDVVALGLGALTGPFAAVLFPVAVAVAWVRRDRWSMIRAGILCLGALTLPFTLTSSIRRTSIGGLGASLAGFCQLLTFQVFAPVFRGFNNSVQFLHPPSLLAAVSYTATIVGLAFLVYVFVRGSLEVRCFIVFGALLLAASLANPAASSVEPQWTALKKTGSPPRYWFIPELVVTAAVVSFACTAGHRVLRMLGAGLVVVMLVVDVAYWRLPDLPHRGFPKFVAAFKALPVGKELKIPIPPNWTFKITKTERD
jgi:hypothetical protein